MAKRKVRKLKIKTSSFKARFLIVSLFVLIAFFIIIGRLFYLQVIASNIDKHKESYSKEKFKQFKRGRILTSDGETLAYDNETYTIVLNPVDFKDEDIDKVVGVLKENIPSINAEELKQEIIKGRNKGKKRLELPQDIDHETNKKIISKISKFKGIHIGGAITSIKNYERKYVKNDAFQELLGFLNIDKTGVYGIEKYYDEELKGVDSLINHYVKRNLRSLSLKALKEDSIITEGRDGYNAVLTIDSILQYALDDEMNKIYTQYDAESSMGILIEVDTGKILAMSSYPKSNDKSQIKNRPITDYFEPGSIFKPITIAMGLQSGVINEFSTVQSSGTIKVADRIIKDHDNKTTGTLTLDKLIALSGNVGMVIIAEKIGDDEFYNYLDDIGYAKKTGIDTFSEFSTKGFPKKQLTKLKKANISFGQGIAMTQIQTLMALNTVINNGNLLRPYIVDRLENSEGVVVKQNAPHVVKKVFSDEVSRINRKLMEGVVSKGTGRRVQIPGYRIGGKTGTAQKAGNRGYEKGKYYSSFFAFFPVDKPKYAILVTVDEPKGGYYGASVALPSVKVVLEKLIKYRGINPQGLENSQEESDFESKPLEMKKSLPRIKQEFNNGIMPELTGLSMREVLTVFPKNRFKNYKFNGDGKVIGQYPKTGSMLSDDMQIIINFE